MTGVGGIVLKHDLFLLVRRGVDPKKGFWCIPGGNVKANETARDAIRREILEVTGIDAEILGVVDLCEFPPYGRDIYVTFLATHVRGYPKPRSDAVEARRFSAKQVRRLKKITTLTKLLVRKVAEGDCCLIQAHTIEGTQEEAKQ